MLDRLLFDFLFSLVASEGSGETIDPWNGSSTRGKRAGEAFFVALAPCESSIEKCQPSQEAEIVTMEASFDEIQS